MPFALKDSSTNEGRSTRILTLLRAEHEPRDLRLLAQSICANAESAKAPNQYKWEQAKRFHLVLSRQGPMSDYRCAYIPGGWLVLSPVNLRGMALGLCRRGWNRCAGLAKRRP